VPGDEWPGLLSSEDCGMGNAVAYRQQSSITAGHDVLGQPTDGMLRRQRGVDSKADVAAAYLIGSRWGLPGRVLQASCLCTTQRLYPSGRWGLASCFGGVELQRLTKVG
jgi:hypothetical protein